MLIFYLFIKIIQFPQVNLHLVHMTVYSTYIYLFQFDWLISSGLVMVTSNKSDRLWSCSILKLSICKIPSISAL